MNTSHKPISEYTLRRIYQSVADTACASINDPTDPPAMPVMLLFDLVGDDAVYTGMVPAEMVLLMHSTRRFKTAIPALIDKMLTRHRCDVLVHVTEASCVRGNAPEIPDMLRAGVTIDMMAGAYPVLVITLHTRDGVTHGMMPITTDNEGKRHVEMLPLDTTTELLDGITSSGLAALQKEVTP